MSTSYETLLLEAEDNGVYTITINRPDKLNALNSTVFNELDQALNELAGDDNLRGLIITGTGDKAFVAGADIKELSSLNPDEAEEKSEFGQRIFSRIESLRVPVIAAVNGYALGGGLELAMACHIRIASPKAQMGLPEVSLGLIPGYGGTQRLAQLTGKAKALELIMTGRFVKAEEAMQIGLVNAVAEESALDEARAMMKTMSRQGPLAIRKAIEAVEASSGNEGYKKEAILFGELFGTDDFKEGTGAFLEKRKPSFSGK